MQKPLEYTHEQLDELLDFVRGESAKDRSRMAARLKVPFNQILRSTLCESLEKKREVASKLNEILVTAGLVIGYPDNTLLRSGTTRQNARKKPEENHPCSLVVNFTSTSPEGWYSLHTLKLDAESDQARFTSPSLSQYLRADQDVELNPHLVFHRRPQSGRSL